MSKIYFLSFADSHMQDALVRIGTEAESMKVFDEITLMTERNLDPSFWQSFGDYCKSHRRGFGYWIWKSHVLKLQLDRINTEDVLVYCDAGCELNPRGKKKLLEYIAQAKLSDLGMAAFSTGLPEKYWCKGDVIDYMSVRDNSQILDTAQFMGGIQIICKNDRNVQFISKWGSICQNNLNLIDDSPSVSPNIEGFIENRHDQSIFSILLKQTGGFAIIPDHEVDVWPDEPWRWHRLKLNPIWAKRNKTRVSEKLAPVYKRMWWDILIFCADLKNIFVNAYSR